MLLAFITQSHMRYKDLFCSLCEVLCVKKHWDGFAAVQKRPPGTLIKNGTIVE